MEQPTYHFMYITNIYNPLIKVSQFGIFLEFIKYVKFIKKTAFWGSLQKIAIYGIVTNYLNKTEKILWSYLKCPTKNKNNSGNSS